MARMTIQDRVEASLARSKANVFLRKDFDKFGDYDQVGRVLRAVAGKGLLVRAGYGVYVKARKSSLTGKPIPVISLTEIGLQAMEKLGVKAELGRAARTYASGESTQMPMAPVIDVGSRRVTRQIGFGSKLIRFE